MGDPIPTRDPNLSYEDMRRLIVWSRIAGDPDARTCAAMLSILDREEASGEPQPPGFVALEDAARRFLRAGGQGVVSWADIREWFLGPRDEEIAALRERAGRAQLERADAIRNAEIADEQRQVAEQRLREVGAELESLLNAVERHRSGTAAEPWHPRIHQDEVLYSLAASIRKQLDGFILDSGRGK